MAEEEKKKPQNPEEPTSPVAAQFKGLPMESLIAAPLTAVCNAQKELAKATLSYIDEIGFKKSKSSSDEQSTRLVKFKLERPYASTDDYSAQLKTYTQEVQAPLLSLVPIPNLLIEETNIDFQMEVSSSEATTGKSQAEASVESEFGFKAGFWGKGSVKVQGKVSTSRENTRSTNQSAKYQIHVSARQQPATEGLSRLMDILAESISPLPGIAPKK